MENINAYNKESFFKEFSTTETYKKLCNDFDIISFDWSLVPELRSENYPTPRQRIGDSNFFKTRFSTVPFYYMEYLLKHNPKVIYDLGCGWNIFKRYVPNLIGIDPGHTESPEIYADITDYIDKDYIENHQNYFDSVFSIGALMFHPLSNFSKVVDDFYSMIKSGGRGFLSINLERMRELDPLFANTPPEEIERFCRDELSKLNHIKFLVVDIRSNPIDEYLDGNVRLVMEK
jgi:hypothetical protein